MLERSAYLGIEEIVAFDEIKMNGVLVTLENERGWLFESLTIHHRI